jgi:hypothetical protein
LKRQIEKEFSDLYPFEEALVCSKLEDTYGYALSNISRVCDLLKNGERIIAIPISKAHDGSKISLIPEDALSSAATTQENFEMVLSMIRNITVKLASRNSLSI